MARRSQDIPIRPRYGIVDETTEQECPEEKSNNAAMTAVKVRKSSSSSTTTTTTEATMASSYTEIPFLARFPGPVPPEQYHSSSNDDVTPTAHNSAKSMLCSNKNESIEEEENDDDVDDDLDDEDDLDDDEEEDSTEEVNEDNSKDSSCDAIKTIPKRPSSLQYDAASDKPKSLRKAIAAKSDDASKTTTSPVQHKDSLVFSSHNSTPSVSTGAGMLTQHFLQTQMPSLDANVLNDIEIEAQYLAASVDNLTENLCNLLHSISSITADNVEVHRNAVNKLTDSMDANIKCMYTIMAKAEEITKAMKTAEKLGMRIRDIRRLVDMLDSAM